MVLVALLTAFISLIVATIIYAVLSGERGCALVEGRAASEEFLGGISFAFAVLLLLFSIVQLVDSSGFVGISDHVRFIVACLGPSLTILFLITGAEDVASAPWVASATGQFSSPRTNTAYFHAVSGSELPISAAVLVVTVIVWCFRHSLRKRVDDAFGPRLIVRALTWTPYLFVGLAITAAVRSTIFSEYDPTSHVREWEVWLWLGVCAIAFVGQSAMLSLPPNATGSPELGVSYGRHRGTAPPG